MAYKIILTNKNLIYNPGFITFCESIGIRINSIKKIHSFFSNYPEDPEYHNDGWNIMLDPGAPIELRIRPSLHKYIHSAKFLSIITEFKIGGRLIQKEIYKILDLSIDPKSKGNGTRAVMPGNYL